MMTIAPPPADDLRLPLTELVNLRDLGGIPAAGGTVRPGLLLRSDDVSMIPPSQAAILAEAGLRLVLDLRSPGEAAYTGRGALAAHEVGYVHLPLTANVAGPNTQLDAIVGTGGIPTPEAVGRWYAILAVTEAETLVRGLELIAATDGPVLFHCAAGKDRTGVFAAAVLSALGADDASIVADYAKTDAVMPAILERLRPVMSAMLGTGASAAPGAARAVLQPESLGALLTAQAESMAAMLALLHREADGLLAILRHADLSRATIARLRQRLVA